MSGNDDNLDLGVPIWVRKHESRWIFPQVWLSLELLKWLYRTQTTKVRGIVGESFSADAIRSTFCEENPSIRGLFWQQLRRPWLCTWLCGHQQCPKGNCHAHSICGCSWERESLRCVLMEDNGFSVPCTNGITTGKGGENSERMMVDEVGW